MDQTYQYLYNKTIQIPFPTKESKANKTKAMFSYFLTSTLFLLPFLHSLLPVLALKQLHCLIELCEVPADASYDGLLELCKASELTSEKHMALLRLGCHRLQIFHWSPSHAHCVHSDPCDKTGRA